MDNFSKFSIRDFKSGDLVHHSSNRTLVLRVEEVIGEANEIKCSCCDPFGIRYVTYFMPEELVPVSSFENMLETGN